MGNDKTKCITNPKSPSFKGPASGQPVSSTGTTVAEGTNCFIDGQLPPGDTYEKYNLVEGVLNGSVFFVPSDGSMVWR